MKQKSTVFLFWVQCLGMLYVISFLAGCASGVSNSVKITEDDIAKYNVMTPEEAVASLENLLQTAKNENLPFYTPSHYSEAEKLYAKALESIQKKNKKKDVIRHVTKADRLLARAKIKKLEVITELGQLLVTHESLVKLDAPAVFKKQYGDLKKKLTGLIVKVEENKADKIDKDKSKLLKLFVALEIKSIKYAALHEASDIRSQAKAKKAPKHAPITYAEAVRVYQQSDADISQNPHDKKNVAEAKERALFTAKHALNVIDRVIDLGRKFKKSPETIILEEEARILKISLAADNSDYRDKLITIQVARVISIVNELSEKSAANGKNADIIVDLRNALEANQESLALSNAERDKAKADLLERDHLLVKMTSDLIKSKSQKKELISLIATLQSDVSDKPKIEENKTVESINVTVNQSGKANALTDEGVNEKI